MPDNTNVNANSAVVVVGRTAPVPPGQQKSDKSIPVVIANDQSTIPVAEQNKVQSEVALSLLGIPRSEVALGIFADVNTYDVNPTEWSADPEQYSTFASEGPYAGVGGNRGQSWGLSHIPAESGALIEAPADKVSVLTSKRFFRYQPGRVSAATFGVKTTTIADSGSRNSNDTTSSSNNNVNGSNVLNNAVLNPCIRKYGIFDKYDGYYWETRNNGQGDNFSVVRRTQSLPYENPVTFGTGSGQQSQDYGRTNPQDYRAPRASESIGAGATAVPTGYENKEFGDLCILRDNLMMTHAACYDPSLLQEEHKSSITSVTNGAVNPTFTFGAGSGVNNTGIAVSISNAVYDISTGLMVVTTHGAHGFKDSKWITLAGIGMTCDIPGVPAGATEIVKIYPNSVKEYNIINVPSSNSFEVNVGVSTVPTFYHGGGWAVGLSSGQYCSYSKGSNVGIITGLVDTQIYRVRTIGINTSTGIVTCTFNTFSSSAPAQASFEGVPIRAGEKELDNIGHSSGSENTVGITSHYMITPVQFVQPIHAGAIANNDAATKNRYGANSVKTNNAQVKSTGTGMFPYMYTDNSGALKEGYIDTSLPTADVATVANQIQDVNDYYRKWVNQSVKKEFWNVYEYRIPRSRFSGDRLDGLVDTQLYSDVVGTHKAGEVVKDANTGAEVTDTSIWDYEFDKVTMLKIEFSWYGAVGALFLAYVPVNNNEARWVRVHHLRCSNQLKMSSLGNATLPITYLVYGGGNQDRFGYTNDKRIAISDDYGSPSQHIVKYGASYYIDGGDRGTVKLFSHATDSPVEVYGSKRTFNVAAGAANVTVSNSGIATSPHIDAGASAGLSTSYYIGSKVITGNPLDQNIKITYINPSTNKLYLNAPLNSTTIPGNSIDIIPDRPTPLVGLKCRDFITSSTGKDVRNRTQVYPTRMSTGSDGLAKIDFLKTPLFQKSSLITNATGPIIGTPVNIGKRGKPTKVDIPLTTYLGTHTWQGGTATAVFRDASNTGNTYSVTAATYNSSTGELALTATADGTDSIPDSATTGTRLEIKLNGLTFSCSLDDHATNHTYPREIDPIFDNTDSAVSGTSAGGWSKHLTVTRSGTSFTVNVTGNGAGTASSAEYIRDIAKPNNSTYGWFKGYYASDVTQKEISILGLLENRGSDRTKNIQEDGYYFSALDATTDDIILFGGTDSRAQPFLREENSIPKDGTGTTSNITESTLSQLSSVKVSPEIRSPIPGTGTVVATLYAPASGESYDLSPYFDYNKEYLSFPLTDKIESLYLCASSANSFNSGIGTISISASLTWEEQ